MTDLHSILNAALRPVATPPSRSPAPRSPKVAPDRRNADVRLPSSGLPLPEPSKLSLQAREALKLLAESPDNTVQPHGTGVSHNCFYTLYRHGLAIRLELKNHCPVDYKLTREGRQMWKKCFRST